MNDIPKAKYRTSALWAAKCLVWIAIFSVELVTVVVLSIVIGTIAFGGLRAITTGAIRIAGNPAARPRIVFACCESPDEAADLRSLFSNPVVISDLKELHAGVAVAIVDLSSGRANAVNLLNKAGIPVTAWLLLPKQQGYYMNSDNAPEGAARFRDFERWTAEYRLRWDAVGIDIEPDLRELAALKQEGGWRPFRYLVRRAIDSQRVTSAREAYAGLIRHIQAGGYTVETYQLPFIVTEREAHSSLLERLLGVVDVRGNIEAVMLYTSFNASIGSAMIWKFGPEAQAITVGVTGGKSGLDWERLSRDLIVAGHFTNLVGIYSLEGCLQQGFLKHLIGMNWGQTVVIPAASVRKAILLHAVLPGTLWTLSHLAYFVVLIIFLNVWFARRRFRRRSSELGTE